ncbi:MAG: serine hydrolase domain-containing protein [Acidobacteriota bacterium]
MRVRVFLFSARLARLSCFALAPLVLGTAAARAEDLGTARVDALNAAVTDYIRKHGIPGLSMAVARDGRVVFSRGYGLADLENSVPATPDTVYRSASIGKSITATAAMKLVETSRLDLDQPVQGTCPAFPKKPWPVTARHLLTHTSGIRHYGGPRDIEEQTSTVHYKSVADALAPFKDDPLLFEPGTKFSYSTYGYDVIGCVVEGAARMSFMDVIRTLVFAPAGMTHSRDDDPAAIIPNRAAGYVRIDGSLRIAPHVDMSNRLPAGGYATTAPDLAAFALNFIDCRLTSCATRDAMLKEVALANRDTVNYGLGWSIEEDKAGKVTGAASHGGSSPGASGILYIVPKRRLAVAILSNLESAPEREAIARAVAAIAAGGTP